MQGLTKLVLSNKKIALDSVIKHAQGLGDTPEKIVKRIFFFRPSPISEAVNDPIFSIFDAISTKFQIPFKSIYISGSAQTGHSLYKQTDFDPENSDLDIAIVDPGMFQTYSEISLVTTNGYTDNTAFPNRSYCEDVPATFLQGLAKGNFRPDLMPICGPQRDLERFFRQLSSEHINSFKSVNSAIYFSQIFLEQKLKPVYSNYVKGIK
jgi:hypothetical protein